ncbi:MAG: ABC transporter ATP-binding protein [Acidimicrobiales bacterium]
MGDGGGGHRSLVRAARRQVSVLVGRAPAKTLLWQLVKEQRWWLGAAIAISAVGFLFQIALGQAAVAVVDEGVTNRTAPLGPLVVRMATLGVLYVTLTVGSVLMMTRVRWTIEYRVRTVLHRSLLAEQVDDDDVATGQVVTRSVADLAQLNNVVYLVPVLLAGAPAVLAGMVYLGYLNLPLMLVTFSCLPVNLYLVLRIRGRIRSLSWLQLQETAEVTRAIDEPIRGIRVVKLFGREPSVVAGVARAARRAYRFALTRVRVLARANALLRLVPALSQAALLLLGARAVQGGSLTTGQFLVFFVGSGQVVFFAQSFTTILDGWSFARTGSSRIGELVDPGGVGVGDRIVGDDRSGGDEADPFGRPRVGWGCEHLSLAVPGGEVTEPTSVAVAPGTVALVTAPAALSLPAVARVLTGAAPAIGGSVWLEEADLHELPSWSARARLRVLDSEPYLFARSVRDNLLLGATASGLDGRAAADDRAADDRAADLERALRSARADEVVATLPGGLDEVLGDRAMNLSGGQRQRLALAQALLAEPRVLVLVEALSGVHTAMEAEILAAIRAAYPDLVVLYLSTRPSAAAAVDQVVDLGPAVDAAPATAVAADPSSTAAALEPGRPQAVALDLAMAAVHGDGGPPVEEAPGPPPVVLADDEPRCDDADEDDPAPPRLANLARPFRRALPALSGVMVAITLIGLAPQWLFGEVNDAIESGGQTTRYAVILVALAAVGALAQWWFDVNAARLANGMLYLLRVRLVRRLAWLGLAYYDRELPGYVATRVLHDLEEVTTFARAVATRLVTVVLTLCFAVLFMALVGAQLVFVILGVVATAVVVTLIEVPLARRAYLRQRAALGDVIARLEEDYNGRAALDAAGAGVEAGASFDELAERLRRAERWAALLAGGYGMAIQWIAEIGGALIMWRSGELVLGGALSIGAMLTVRLYLQQALNPIMELGNLLQQQLRARVSFDRLRQPYEADVLPVERPDAVDCDALPGDIELDDVHFRYPGTTREVLAGTSLRLPAGRTIAVVGPTGAGKSTVAKLVTRVYDPDRGAVRVGGVDLRDLTLASVRRRIGVVPQEPFLFGGTVADNVAYGRPDAPRVELEAAVAAVGATAGLADLPGGLDAPVLEEGINLTPQQRQLVALARAWLVAPDVLVLDESTSALDERTELAVLDALARRTGTTVFVTHREQVAHAADVRVLVDHGGGVVVDDATAQAALLEA